MISPDLTVRVLYVSSRLLANKKQSSSALLSLTCYVPVYITTIREIEQQLSKNHQDNCSKEKEEEQMMEDLLIKIFHWLNSSNNPLIDDQKHQNKVSKYQVHTQMIKGDIIMVGSRYFQVSEYGFRQRDESKFI